MTTMTTDDEDASIERMQTALLRRCHDSLAAFSEREFERNTGHTYVPGCTPTALAGYAKAFVPPDPRKRAYREAAHLGGQGVILAQPPTAAIERAYVDQPVCPVGGRPDAVPLRRDSDGGCPIRNPQWGIVRARSKPISNPAVDYADEPTIKCETPTECLPTTVPCMPDSTANGPGVLQSAVVDMLEHKDTGTSNPSAAPSAIVRSWQDIAHDFVRWRHVPGATNVQKLKMTLLHGERPFVLAITGALAILAILCIAVFLATMKKSRVQ